VVAGEREDRPAAGRGKRLHQRVRAAPGAHS
jgi:hypothetical protein